MKKTSEQISKMYDRKTAAGKVEILFRALDFMKSYNGRSKFDCIAMAMGYQDKIGDGKIYEPTS